MTEEQIIKLIENQSIELPNSGIDRFPGGFMRLDTDQIEIDGKSIEIAIEAWYDFDKKNRLNLKANNFIVHYRCKYIIVDYFFEAKHVWDFLLKKYPV